MSVMLKFSLKNSPIDVTDSILLLFLALTLAVTQLHIEDRTKQRRIISRDSTIDVVIFIFVLLFLIQRNSNRITAHGTPVHKSHRRMCLRHLDVN